MQRKLNTSGLKSLYLPSRIPGPDRLLVVLHGLGDSLEGFKFLPEVLQIPGLNYLLINAPDPYFTGYSWYEINAAMQVMEAGVVRSRGLLFQLIKEIKHHGFPPEHVGVLGFSQGCLMALDLACRFPEKLGAFVGISGYASHLAEYPEKLSATAREQTILVTHGTEDELLPIDRTKAQIKALKGMGMNIEWKSYRKEHTIEPRQEVADIKAYLLRTLCREQALGS